MWLYYGLTSMTLFGVINVIDAHCVKEIFNKPWIGVIVGAFSTLIIILMPAPFIAPFIEITTGKPFIILLALTAGVALQISNYFYFMALGNSEAGIVSAYWNLTPCLVPIGSYFIYGEVLSYYQYIGILILVVTSVMFYSLDENHKARLQSLLYMVGASTMLGSMFLMQEHIFNEISFIQGFIIINIGLSISGLLPLLHKKILREFSINLREVLPVLKIFVAIELINLIAIAFSQKSIDVGAPARVAALETTLPGITFLLSLVLLILIPRFGDKRAKANIGQKLLLVVLMTIGVMLLQ